MRVKFIMSWNVTTSAEREYYEFIVNEFIPNLSRLGITNLEFWYTMYGDYPQIQSSGIAQNMVQMNRIQSTTEWEEIISKLELFVGELTEKVIPANNSFQL